MLPTSSAKKDHHNHYLLTPSFREEDPKLKRTSALNKEESLSTMATIERNIIVTDALCFFSFFFLFFSLLDHCPSADQPCAPLT